MGAVEQGLTSDFDRKKKSRLHSSECCSRKVTDFRDPSFGGGEKEVFLRKVGDHSFFPLPSSRALRLVCQQGFGGMV